METGRDISSPPPPNSKQKIGNQLTLDDNKIKWLVSAFSSIGVRALCSHYSTHLDKELSMIDWRFKFFFFSPSKWWRKKLARNRKEKKNAVKRKNWNVDSIRYDVVCCTFACYAVDTQRQAQVRKSGRFWREKKGSMEEKFRQVDSVEWMNWKIRWKLKKIK